MRLPWLALALLLAACNESGGWWKSEDKSKRPTGMSEEIWKIYGGAESGVMEDKRKEDKPKDGQPRQEKK